jgi:hypothetical protein
METIFFWVNTIIVATLLFSIIFTAGVVWRVEKRLDISYKFFLAAIVCVFMAEVLDLYYTLDSQVTIALLVKTLRMFFAIFFLTGVLFMRNILRKLDGEKES